MFTGFRIFEDANSPEYGILDEKEQKGALLLDLKEQVLQICEVLYDKKALDIVAIHVADKTIIADWFVICSGRAVPQTKALCDELSDRTPELGLELRRREGYADGRWIVLDYAHILVHIFIPEERQYYNMERLWMDDPAQAILYSQLQDETAQS